MSNQFAPTRKLLQNGDRLGQLLNEGHTIPVTVEIYPTYYCNNHCPTCDFRGVNNNAKKVAIDIPLCKRALADMAEAGVRGVNWGGGGEPTLHSALPSFLEAGMDAGLSQGMFTNGTVMNDKLMKSIIDNLKWIRFSVNSGCPNNYGAVHGTTPKTYHHILQNIQKLIKAKNEAGVKLTVGVSYFVNGMNYKDAEPMAYLADDIGADYIQFRPDTTAHPNLVDVYYKHIVERSMGWAFRPMVRWTEYKWIDARDREHDFGRNYNKCTAPWFMMAVGAEGKVWACSEQAGSDEAPLGNLNTESFKDCISPDRIIAFIESTNPKTCRKLCKGHEINKTMHLIYNPDRNSHPEHI